MNASERLAAYLYARINEVSTWQGVIVVLSAFGYHFTPEQAGAIFAAGVALAGVLGVILPDRLKTNTRANDQPGENKS